MEQKQVENLVNLYIKLAEKQFGKLPEQCYDVEIELVKSNSVNAKAHYANFASNTLFINPELVEDVEWAVFHEMEHLEADLKLETANTLGDEPSAAEFSKQTKRLKRFVQNEYLLFLSLQKEKQKISDAEFTSRLKAMHKLISSKVSA